MSDEGLEMWEIREDENNHPLIRNFRGSSVYETNGPVKPRIDFRCDACETNIPRGTDVKFVIKAYGDDGDWPSTNICGHCYHEDEEVKKAYDRIMSGEFDYD